MNFNFTTAAPALALPSSATSASPLLPPSSSYQSPISGHSLPPLFLSLSLSLYASSSVSLLDPISASLFPSLQLNSLLSLTAAPPPPRSDVAILRWRGSDKETQSGVQGLTSDGGARRRRRRRRRETSLRHQWRIVHRPCYCEPALNLWLLCLNHCH
ncbi:hypothetical protein LOK49_LG11G01283 [Camellia lanceoleosa]|uniref:Uncharacterized protein n=1 Tax=Camellia lanceoleosa TaxID=1840588 RepID=A0ACC0FWE7_9ERIC|nr:hypothetical protein LOK49_LG11G01283 [Camellia lanceoleosa]